MDTGPEEVTSVEDSAEAATIVEAALEDSAAAAQAGEAQVATSEKISAASPSRERHQWLLRKGIKKVEGR